jgi:hypothetical protein
MAPPKLTRLKRKPRPLSLPNDAANGDGETATPDTPTATPIKKMATYPAKQLLILAACRFSEPVAMTSSFPYLFFMIRDFHLSDDEKKIGGYAGLLASSFSFAQFFSGSPPLFSELTERASMGSVVGFVWSEIDCAVWLARDGGGDPSVWVLDDVYTGFDCKDIGGTVER